MDTSFGLFFYLKKDQRSPKGEIPIYLRITVDTACCDISIKRKCDPAKWIPQAGRVNPKTDIAKTLNPYLDALQQSVFAAKRKLIEREEVVTAESIKNLMQGKEKNIKHMLLEIFKHHNKQMAALVGREYAPGTLVRYQTSFRHTQSFLQSRYKMEDIEIGKLDFEFITEYEFWLKSVRKCDHNSTMKYLSNFNKIVNRCIRNGWIKRDPFLGFSMTKREVKRTALTEHELTVIAGKQFEIERLAVVRDVFIFSCFSGLAYADVKKLKRSEIIIGVDGKQWITSRRQKTDITAKIPLLPIALSIIERYNNHVQCKLDDHVLPVLSNQKMNAYLKEIADVCGITKTLTYHIARHTFATTVTLSNGVPLETVSKMLGHRNLKTTQHYARILDKKISDDMQGLQNKYSTFNQ